MILADKIISLRKKSGWSQEELAEQLGVTRQSVSKWEGAQSVPDMDKILQISRIFGVTTDFLLKDEIEKEELNVGEDSILRKITLEEAITYLELRRAAAPKVALATFLCIISPIALILLTGLSTIPQMGISENMACGVGLCVLMILVAAAVSIFLSCSSKTKEYDFLEKEPFEREYGISGVIKEKQKIFNEKYSSLNIMGTVFCILSVVPLFLSLCFKKEDFFYIAAVCLLLFIVAFGVFFFVLYGVQKSAFDKLLEQDDYTRDKKAKSGIKTAVTVAYWLVVTAGFVIYVNMSNNAKIGWIIWAVAGIIYGAVAVVMNKIYYGEKR